MKKALSGLFGPSWKTSLFGYLLAVLFAGPEIAVLIEKGLACEEANWLAIFAGIAAAVFGRLTRDNNKTSEDVKAPNAFSYRRMPMWAGMLLPMLLVACAPVNKANIVEGTGEGLSYPAGFTVHEDEVKFGWQGRNDGTWYQLGDLDIATNSQPAVWRMLMVDGTEINFAAPGDVSLSGVSITYGDVSVRLDDYASVNSSLVLALAEYVKARDAEVEAGAITQQERDAKVAETAAALAEILGTLGLKAMTGN